MRHSIKARFAMVFVGLMAFVLIAKIGRAHV